MGITQVVTKKSQWTDHAVIEICMTRTLNEDYPSINTLGVLWKGGEKKKREKRVKEVF